MLMGHPFREKSKPKVGLQVYTKAVGSGSLSSCVELQFCHGVFPRLSVRYREQVNFLLLAVGLVVELGSKA